MTEFGYFVFGLFLGFALAVLLVVSYKRFALWVVKSYFDSTFSHVGHYHRDKHVFDLEFGKYCFIRNELVKELREYDKKFSDVKGWNRE